MTERDDGPRFDPHGPDLVYMLIADEIEARIERGELHDGQRLPGEIALAEEYGVARMTIRRASRELRERGLVRVVTGKGTYITVPSEARRRDTPPGRGLRAATS
jgi:GntR family transcriptional regulator